MALRRFLMPGKMDKPDLRCKIWGLALMRLRFPTTKGNRGLARSRLPTDGCGLMLPYLTHNPLIMCPMVQPKCVSQGALHPIPSVGTTAKIPPRHYDWQKGSILWMLRTLKVVKLRLKWKSPKNLLNSNSSWFPKKIFPARELKMAPYNSKPAAAWALTLFPGAFPPSAALLLLIWSEVLIW